MVVVSLLTHVSGVWSHTFSKRFAVFWIDVSFTNACFDLYGRKDGLKSKSLYIPRDQAGFEGSNVWVKGEVSD